MATAPDPLGDALRVLDAQDGELKSVVIALANELRQSNQETLQYINRNEVEKQNATAAYNQLVQELKDAKASSESRFSDLARNMTQMQQGFMSMQRAVEKIATAIPGPAPTPAPATSASSSSSGPSTAATFGIASTARTGPIPAYKPEFLAAFLTPPQPGSILAMAIDGLQVAY